MSCLIRKKKYFNDKKSDVISKSVRIFGSKCNSNAVCLKILRVSRVALCIYCSNDTRSICYTVFSRNFFFLNFLIRAQFLPACDSTALRKRSPHRQFQWLITINVRSHLVRLQGKPINFVHCKTFTSYHYHSLRCHDLYRDDV